MESFVDDTFGKFSAINVVGIISIFVLLLNVVAGYCLCCHPDRDDEKAQFVAPTYATASYQKV